MRPQRSEQRRADALDDALHARPVDDAALARETRALVRAAEAVLRAEHPEPDPSFVVALRERVVADARTTLTAEPRTVVRVRAVPARRRRTHRRRAAALVAALAVAAGSVGVVGASAQALPGQSLYPVKLGVEQVELGLQRGPTGTGRKQLELADERLAEAQALADGGLDARERGLVTDALDAFSRRAEAGSADLLRAYATTGSTSTVRDVEAFVGSSEQRLQRLRGVLPAASVPALTRAGEAVRGIGVATNQACDGCAAGLADAVDDLAGEQPSDASPSPEQPPASPGATAPTDSADADDRQPVPSDAPSVQVPQQPRPSASPSPSALPPEVRDPVRSITDPVLGGLLGRAPTTSPDPGTQQPDQEGLVPGLLDGLLGQDTPRR